MVLSGTCGSGSTEETLTAGTSSAISNAPRGTGRHLSTRVTAMAMVLLLSGCGTTYLQPPMDPPDPRTVFVVDHGRHTSLVISTETGSLVRYAYGDWRYYADRDTRLRTGAAALFCRTPSTLARRELPGPPDPATLRAQLRVGVEVIHTLQVSGAAADRLRDELDGLHAGGALEHQFVAEYDLVFAPYPQPYTWRNNSATKIASWLEQMGVEIKGPALVARWSVVQVDGGESR